MPSIPSVCQPLADKVAELESDLVDLQSSLDPEDSPQSQARIRSAIRAKEGEISRIRKDLSYCIEVHSVPLPQVRMCSDQTASGPALRPRNELTTLRIESDGAITAITHQPLAADTSKMWDTGQTLRVKMMGGTSHIRSKVRQYAEMWTQYANIHFAFVDPSQSAEIRIAFDSGGSHSLLGRDALWVPFNFATMNFGWFTDDTPDFEFRRVVLHEFGHALGFIHEHQSPAGGIQWDKEKAYAYYWETQRWDRGMVDAQVFQKYAVSMTNYSQYDRTSIMHYHVDPSLTLDGNGAPWNNDLSPTDRQWAGRSYPYPPTPQNSNGLLRTGDDCDEIDFAVEYGVVGSNDVEFRLFAASGLTWWKAIQVPVSASSYRMLEIQDGSSAAQTIPLTDLDTSRPMRFWKAKLFGVHTQLGYTWDVVQALPGGTRLSLTWKRASC